MGELSLYKKIRSATLLETMVALVIMLVLFGIVTTVMVQTLRGTSAEQQWKAAASIEQVVRDTRLQQSWFDEELAIDGLLIQKKVAPFQHRKDLLQVNISVYGEDNRLIMARQQLMQARNGNK